MGNRMKAVEIVLRRGKGDEGECLAGVNLRYTASIYVNTQYILLYNYCMLIKLIFIFIYLQYWSLNSRSSH
jgi:hypothetical protein